MEKNILDVIVIGGGQSGLVCGYYLRRTGLTYLILDKQPNCGGSWIHGWDSLTLFSPAVHSSLSGWLMPKSLNFFPSKVEVIDYLCQYEKKYALPVQRPVEVKEVEKMEDIFTLITDKGEFHARTIIAATGTFGKPYIPGIKGREKFSGIQIHSAFYKNPEAFAGLKVLVVGEGNSGAQILAEVSEVTETDWATRDTPAFLPDDVDGHVLFNIASAKYHAEKAGIPFDPSQYSLGNIVMVPPVVEARERGDLVSIGSFTEMDETGIILQNGTRKHFDAVIWCTGFGYDTDILKKVVQTDERGKTPTLETRATQTEGLWLVGYGGWTGYASATLIGVGRTAKQTAQEIQEYLKGA
ncbi:MAG: NAD(P)/FAD-dependent oxidoreductase [Bacteroidia bacterium]|nr:NAD(P)/FAD-dependent oxidoreductase [Bacteroidia bacterium]